MAANSNKNPTGVRKCIELMVAAGAKGDRGDYAGNPPWKFSKDNAIRKLMGGRPVEEDEDDNTCDSFDDTNSNTSFSPPCELL